ncbi:MAG: DUF4388 domain-containing protein [Desulfococcaceae bacterium]|jgi:CRP-like cAMP-binding protein|nr:DUF4388 domain-containing protein [Desulfococcaceae bacterium]
MQIPKVSFKIIEENNCPFYKYGDEFLLSGKALLLEHKEHRKFITTSIIDIPRGKPECPILYGDISNVLIKYQSISKIPTYVMNCSGCTGSIRLEYDREKRCGANSAAPHVPPPAGKKRDIAEILRGFSIFRTLDLHNIRELLSFFQVKKYPSGSIIVQQGEPGKNLYIIVSGKAAVADQGGVLIASLGPGEVFGEMSLLSGEAAVATVTALEAMQLLFMSGKDFRNILNRFPSLQIYLARLLSKRLARANVTLSAEIRSGMIGKLSDMPSPELFQVLGENKKTGILTLTLPQGPAKFFFRDGDIVFAKYNNKSGKEAFFDALGEKDGRFRFVPGLPAEYKKANEIGNLMWLLMEGLRRIDEQSGEI